FVTDPGWSGNLVDKPTTDKERYGQIDFGLKFDGVLKRIQLGYKYRKHETGQEYAGIALTGLAVPASNFNTSIVRDNYLSGFDGINDQMRGRFIIDGNSMVNYVQSRPGLPTPSKFAASEFTAGNWDIQEQIHAFY
ncbi:TonB-dependent receptor, partial [Escherichia coli]|nr:TonB-dependent receptor [Escherichia coli]